MKLNIEIAKNKPFIHDKISETLFKTNKVYKNTFLKGKLTWKISVSV